MEVIERYSFKFEGILEVKTSQKKKKKRKKYAKQILEGEKTLFKA